MKTNTSPNIKSTEVVFYLRSQKLLKGNDADKSQWKKLFVIKQNAML